MAHSIKPGVATGDEVQQIFKYAKQKGFALPAVNVIGSDTLNGVLLRNAGVATGLSFRNLMPSPPPGPQPPHASAPRTARPRTT